MAMDALCAAGDVLVYNTFNAAAAASSFHFGNAGGAGADGGASWIAASAVVAPVPVTVAMPAEDGEKQVQAGRRKRRRRARSCKNREDAESQRMTHIAVERNRRRQMNEYLAVLRSLMPESYAHRGDQASIVGGAIDFVKELEQRLQSLEAQKRTLLLQKQHRQQHKPPVSDAMPTPSTASPTVTATSSGSGASQEAAADHDSTTGIPFAGFFTYPQYVWRLPPRDGADNDRAGAADVEVSLVDTHASVRVMAPRRPGQLLGMVAGMERHGLAVLHLNVTTLDTLVLYTLSVKVEEGCGLATADEIAAAVHQLLCFIDAETTSEPPLLDGGQPDLLAGYVACRRACRE